MPACSHRGLEDEGHFEFMCSLHSISATVDHHACMVHLLGLAALYMRQTFSSTQMPFDADSCVCVSLLSPCTINSNVEMRECIMGKDCWN